MRPEIDGKPNSTKGVSADAFLQSYMSEDPAPYADIGSQHSFLSNKAGELGVDRLFRFEDLGALVAYLNKRLRTDVAVGRLNASPACVADLSAETAAAYRRHAAKDFALYESLR